MEKINSNNYEAYFLDYMEGNLTAQQEFELIDFLDKNPALKAELEFDFSDVTLKATPAAIDKSALKREGIQPEEVDDLMIASVEGQLAVKDQSALNTYVDNHKLHRDFKYYQNTVLKPDLSVGYGNNADLKKKDRFVPLWVRITAVAGIGAVVVGIAINQFNQTEPIENIESPILVEHPVQTEHQSLNENNLSLEQEQTVTENVVNVFAAPGEDNNNTTSYFEASDVRPSSNDGEQITPIKERKDTKSDGIGSNTNNEEEDSDSNLDNEKVEDGGLKENPNKEKGEKEFPEREPKKAEEPMLDYEQYKKEKNKVVTEEPIKVVTNFAERVFKKDVSYERDKDTGSGENVGHHFKFGKFEFERKKK